jgi:hypothetical protein
MPFSAQATRKAAVLNTTFTEIMLVFILILALFTFETNQNYNLKVKSLEIANQTIKRLEKESRELKIRLNNSERENKNLKSEIEDLKRFIGARPGSGDNVQELLTKIRRLEEEIAKLQKPKNILSGKGGIGLPNCLGQIRWRYIFKVKILTDYYIIESELPRAEEEMMIRQVPGMRSLLNDSPLREKQFLKAAQNVYKWAREQNPECRFRVKVVKKYLQDDSLSAKRGNELIENVTRRFYQFEVQN